MTLLHFRPKQGSVVWVEPHRVRTAGQERPAEGLPSEDLLAQALTALPAGPTVWIMDDQWAPAVLLRDIVEVPVPGEGRDAFFRWRYSQSLALEGTHSVQALSLTGDAWLLAGMPQELRDAWLQLALRLGRPIASLVPRWLWLYNRLAPTREVPGMLLSLCPHPDGGFTGTLAAWGRSLALLRQWNDPVDAEGWMRERVMPTSAYLQRDSRSPQELWIWGTSSWPEDTIHQHMIQPEIPALEAV